MQHSTPLIAPSWATDHRADDCLTWTRAVQVDVIADGTPHGYRVEASLDDRLVVRGGHVLVERNDEAVVLVDGAALSLSDARAVAHAILSVVDAVEPAVAR